MQKKTETQHFYETLDKVRELSTIYRAVRDQDSFSYDEVGMFVQETVKAINKELESRKQTLLDRYLVRWMVSRYGERHFLIRVPEDNTKFIFIPAKMWMPMYINYIPDHPEQITSIDTDGGPYLEVHNILNIELDKVLRKFEITGFSQAPIGYYIHVKETGF